MQKKIVRKLSRSFSQRGVLTTAKMLAYELYFEWKFKIKTRKMYGHFGYNGNPHSSMYMATSYFLLQKLLKQLFLLVDKEKIVFVDYGSGRGRVLIYLSTYPTGKIYGVEFSDYLCEDAKKNVNHFDSSLLNNRIHIINADATQFQPPKDCNVFFYNNPFGPEILEPVLQKVDESLATEKKDIYAIYYNPRHVKSFKRFGYDEVYVLKSRKNVEAIIYRKSYSKTRN